ncbi:MAG: hypothetical protein GY913_30265 [Proteobacteria bacterium]|nr:hypothetical protein [Pseudomonadota bacterium]MCP4921203.1 hypothetical protein [Pseudomonadota bacterium]
MWWLLACVDPVVEDTAWERGPNPHGLDDQLRLNHVQAEGSHNSTHIEPDAPVDDSHRYTHAPLGDQLDQQGVRQVELDLHLTEDGTWQIFHLPVVDAETTCLELVDCLQDLKDWSNAAEWGLPIMVWMEPKDDVDHMVEGLQAIEEYDTLEETILSVWPRERILTPDDVRGDHADLPTALAEDGWPTLGEVRGKVVFAMLDAGAHREAYIEGAPALEGRLLFVDSSSMEDPYAATFKDGGHEDTRTWSAAGFLVTVNAGSLKNTPEQNSAEVEAAFDAGAHFVATDFPDNIEIPGGTPARCHVLTAPTECTSQDIEGL